MSYSQRAQQPTTARRLAVFMSCRLRAAALLHSVTAHTQPQQRGTERRVAPVIGNPKYAGIPLDNPQRDARLIADTLRKPDVLHRASLGEPLSLDDESFLLMECR